MLNDGPPVEMITTLAREILGEDVATKPAPANDSADPLWNSLKWASTCAAFTELQDAIKAARAALAAGDFGAYTRLVGAEALLNSAAAYLFEAAQTIRGQDQHLDVAVACVAQAREMAAPAMSPLPRLALCF